MTNWAIPPCDLVQIRKGGGGGRHPCSYITISRDFFQRAKYFLFIMRKVISIVSKYIFTECEMMQIWIAKADFGLRKQTSGAKGGFLSAKTGIGVRKGFLRQAGDFFPWNHSRIFLRSLPAPPPPKNEMVAP